MSDTMRRTLCAALTACLTAYSFFPVPDASACNAPIGRDLIWPIPEDPDGGEPQPAPLDTRVWLRAGPYSGDLTFDVLIEDQDGQPVAAASELLRGERNYGAQSGILVLTPKAELAPLATYTVSIVHDDEAERVERAAESGDEYQRTSWRFTTGDGVYGVSPPSGLATEYVALERPQSYSAFCEQHTYDTRHVLRVPNPANEEPLLHTFEFAYPGEPTETARLFWTGSRDDAADRRVEFSKTIGRAEYPCVTHVMTDIVGRTHRGEPSCAPSFCLEPPLIAHEGSPNEPHATFSRASFDAWRRLATPCSLDPGFGCSTAPASPIPHAPLALGGLALLALLTRRRSEQ